MLVAHVNGEMQEFCNQYRKQKRLPSITKLLLTGLPGGVGKKGNRINRERKHNEVTTTVPLSVSGPSVVTQPPPQAQSVTEPIISSPGTKLTQGVGRKGEGVQHTKTYEQFDIPRATRSTEHPISLPSTVYTPPSMIPSQSPASQPEHSLHSYGQAQYRPFPFQMTNAVFPLPHSYHTYSPTISYGTNPWDYQAIGQMPQQHSTQTGPHPVLSGGLQSTRCGETSLFEVCFRSGNISVCNGCRNKFDRLARPPHDLCIRHKEWRSFTSPVTNQLETRFGNACYHPNPTCIRARCVDFNTSLIHIPSDILMSLQPEHKYHLNATFGLQI